MINSPLTLPKPMGAERIVYGDKVINLGNHRRDGNKVWPRDGSLGYLANGEIGVAVGQWKTRGSPKILKVEFSSQVGFTYDFYGSDFREEGNAALELAYALTVHKAQGSQFELVILVLPEGHPILSRELIYTALTRHQRRVVVMHQGPRTLLKDFAAPHMSETARRRTNLLSDCHMIMVPQTKRNVFLQEGLIHRTSKGIAVRSKSELLIAEALHSENVAFEYEKGNWIALVSVIPRPYSVMGGMYRRCRSRCSVYMGHCCVRCDPDGAQRTRAKELTRTKEVERDVKPASST